jgi:uncharacterized protein (DUF924 family)
MNDNADGAERVLRLWFGELDERGRADAEHTARWWKKDPAFDESLRQQFASEHAAVAAGQREAWLATPRGRLATIIVLDQLSRNMYRSTPRMFAFDARALEVAKSAIEQQDDRRLCTDERTFLYIPLMHSEDLATQQRSVQLFTQFCEELDDELRKRITYNLDFAIQHRDIIARFGRFPHRNEVLGRSSTQAELEFLKQPGSAF